MALDAVLPLGLQEAGGGAARRAAFTCAADTGLVCQVAAAGGTQFPLTISSPSSGSIGCVGSDKALGWLARPGGSTVPANGCQGLPHPCLPGDWAAAAPGALAKAFSAY